MLFYIASGNANMEQLRQDVERVERDLESAVSEWRTIEHSMQSSQQKLHELRSSVHDLGDLLSIDDRTVEIQEEITKTARKLRDARRYLFQVIGPQEQEFDPSRDYEREYDGAGVIQAEHTDKDARRESVERPREKGEGKPMDSAGSTPETRRVYEADGKAVAEVGDDLRPMVGLVSLSSDTGDGAVNEKTSETPDSDARSLAADKMPAVDGLQSGQSSGTVPELV